MYIAKEEGGSDQQMNNLPNETHVHPGYAIQENIHISDWTPQLHQIISRESPAAEDTHKSNSSSSSSSQQQSKENYSGGSFGVVPEDANKVIGTPSFQDKAEEHMCRLDVNMKNLDTNLPAMSFTPRGALAHSKAQFLGP